MAATKLRRRRRVAGAVARIGAERRAVAARHDQMPQALAPVGAPGLGERGAVEVGLEVAHESLAFFARLSSGVRTACCADFALRRSSRAAQPAQIDGKEG